MDDHRKKRAPLGPTLKGTKPREQDVTPLARNVRFWHKADMLSCTAHVRYWGQSGHAILHCKCPLMTQSGHRRPNLIGCENWRRA